MPIVLTNLLSHLKKQIKLIFVPFYTQRKALAILRGNDDVKIEIGSGPKKKDGWVTIDLSFAADLYWDLRDKLPFPDNSVSLIYSSHVLEHFSYRDLRRLIDSCYAILKPGGRFSACVPNARIYLEGYLSPQGFDRSLFAYEPAFVSNLPIDIVNYIAYMDGHHRHMFDEKNLVKVLEDAGFKGVHLRDFDSSLDMPERSYESIYVEGFK